jgi:hypothetical protein
MSTTSHTYICPLMKYDVFRRDAVMNNPTVEVPSNDVYDRNRWIDHQQTADLSNNDRDTFPNLTSPYRILVHDSNNNYNNNRPSGNKTSIPFCINGWKFLQQVIWGKSFLNKSIGIVENEKG